MPAFSPASSTAVALTVLSGCCVVARLFSRLAFVKHVGIDDCLITLAWSASIALTVVTAQCKYYTSSFEENKSHSPVFSIDGNHDRVGGFIKPSTCTICHLLCCCCHSLISSPIGFMVRQSGLQSGCSFPERFSAPTVSSLLNRHGLSTRLLGIGHDCHRLWNFCVIRRNLFLPADFTQLGYDN